MKQKLLLLLIGIGIFNSLSAQNLIPNGDFETVNSTSYDPGGSLTAFFNTHVPNWVNGCPHSGSQGSPDLFSTQNTNCKAQVPSNSWANNLPARLAGTNSYVGMWSGSEALRCGFSQALTANITYTLAFYATRNQGHFNCGQTVAGADPTPLQVQATLKKSSDPCSGGLTVLVSQVINFSGWQNVTGTFMLTPAQAAMGYDRLEFRTLTNLSGPYFFMDDVSLNGPFAVADFDFATPGQTVTNMPSLFGSLPVTQICAAQPPAETDVFINGSASTYEDRYHLSIIEFDINSWTSVTSTPMYAAWQTPLSPVPTSNINLNNLPGVIFQPGKIYQVALSVGPDWNTHFDYIRINPLPAINAGSDLTACNGGPASVNVITSNWPVKVYKGFTLISTSTANPIMLTPTAPSSTYSFVATTAYGCAASDMMTITPATCPVPSFIFKQHCGSIGTEPSYYGPLEVTTLFINQPIIDGSATTNENGYHLAIGEIDINSWTFGATFYNGWYATSGQIGDVNLNTVIHTNSGNNNNGNNNFVVGQVYIVGLSVSPPWTTMNRFFRVSPCTKSLEMTDESGNPLEAESLIGVYPNPTSGLFTVELSGIQAEEISVTNVLGEVIGNAVVTQGADSVEIDLSSQPAGVYMVHVKTGDSILLKRVVRK